jgi:D-sedoheptulose 7-phosphate isomerase
MIEHAINQLIVILNNSRALLPIIEAAGEEIKNVLSKGNKILTAGNGGSAADAMHMAEEFLGRFEKDRAPWPAISLCADTTLLTCIANDYGFDQIFARQIEGLGLRGDLLIVFTTSGNSLNIVNALTAARKIGLRTIAVMGNNGGRSKGIADYEIIVPSVVSARIQEVHTLILHSWLQKLESDVQVKID